MCQYTLNNRVANMVYAVTFILDMAVLNMWIWIVYNKYEMDHILDSVAAFGLSSQLICVILSAPCLHISPIYRAIFGCMTSITLVVMILIDLTPIHSLYCRSPIIYLWAIAVYGVSSTCVYADLVHHSHTTPNPKPLPSLSIQLSTHPRTLVSIGTK